MSDDNNQSEATTIPQGEASERQRGPMMEIELTPEGLAVRGNAVLKNPIMAYGMLEVAKDTIRRMYDKANESPIARVPFMPPGLRIS